MKRTSYFGGAAVAACIAIFVYENRFLFSFHSIRDGMDKIQVESCLGKPWMWSDYARPAGLSDEQWESSIGCDGEEYWRYRLGFCGLHMRLGEWQVRFHRDKVVRISAQIRAIDYEEKWPELPLKLPSGDTIFLSNTEGLGKIENKRRFMIQYKTEIQSPNVKDHVAQMKEIVRAFQDQADKAGIDVMMLMPMLRSELSDGSSNCAYEIRKTPSGEWLPLNHFPW